MSTTVAVFSSSRSNGNTRKLLANVASKINIDTIDLSEYTFSDYDYEHKNEGDDFLPLIDRVLAYENIIFASPVYWYSVTPVMKKFLDRISDLLELPHLLDTGRRLRGKTAFVLCSSVSREASNAFISAFEETFEYLGMSYGGFIHANCDAGYQAENYAEDLAGFTALLKTRRAYVS
jgi:multimeric flavodoxin WrbA